MILIAVSTAFVVAAVALALRHGLSVLHLAAASLVPVMIGALLLRGADQTPAFVPLYFAAGATATMVGGLLATTSAAGVSGKGRITRRLPPARSAIIAISSLIVLATMVHFIRAGVPLFSSDVETDRFDFGASGLYGIPGRAYLFGLPIVLALAVGSSTTPRLLQDRLVLFIGAVFVASRIAGGFKSGLLEVVTTMAVIYIAIKTRANVTRTILQLTALVIVALGFSVLVGGLYATYQNGNVISTVLDRATTRAALAPATILAYGDDLDPFFSSPLHRDLGYFSARYLGIGEPLEYSYGDVVALRMNGVSLQHSLTPAPVTTTFFAEAYATVGLPIALALLTGCGFSIVWLEREGTRTILAGRSVAFMLAVTCLLALFQLLTKGRPVYLLINWGVVAMVTAAALSLLSSLTTRSSDDRKGLSQE